MSDKNNNVDIEAYTSIIVNGYKNVAKASQKAIPLQKAYMVAMQTKGGYEAAEGVTILKDVNGVVSGVMKADTFYNVKNGLAQGFLIPVKATPPIELIEAIKTLDGSTKEFLKVVADALLPLRVGVPKSKKNVNMPSNGSVRTPSKGFISDEEWAGISSEEKSTYDMTFDGTGITLIDLNGEEHYTKSISALKRHENGEGHALKA